MSNSKTKLDSVLSDIEDAGFGVTLTPQRVAHIAAAGFTRKNLPLAIVATDILHREKPITLRGLFYRVVSAGWLPSTDRQHYTRLGRMMTTLREAGCVPFDWLVDNLRNSIKPSSWSGLGDFADTVRDAYRMDFWARLPEYVHIFCEKDAIAGVIAPVTREFDVALSPIRGYVSLSFAHQIASTWSEIEKPIFAYYLGDFDPSGFDLERDLRHKLDRYCDRPILWERLAVNADDFEAFGLLPLRAKTSDRRYASFVAEHGTRCAELDALPATEIRARVRNAIERHIPSEEWERLRRIEAAERESFHRVMAGFTPSHGGV